MFKLISVLFVSKNILQLLSTNNKYIRAKIKHNQTCIAKPKSYARFCEPTQNRKVNLRTIQKSPMCIPSSHLTRHPYVDQARSGCLRLLLYLHLKSNYKATLGTYNLKLNYNI